VFAALAGSAYAQLNASFVSQLKGAATAPQRMALLRDSDLLFDFVNPTSGVVTGAGGRTVEASSSNFGAVVGNGVAMTIGFLGPCGINTPHTHPRATEINFSVNGTLRAGLLTENGARFVINDLTPGVASVFPQGAIHFEMNMGCETALFVAAFNDEDPGVNSIAQRFFGLAPDIVGASLGGLGVTEVVGLENLIPDNVVAGTDECLRRCGLARPSQPTLERQPIVSGNNPSLLPGATPAAPSSSAARPATTAPAASSSARPSSATTATTARASTSGSPQVAEAIGSTGSNNTSSSTSPILIALVAINSFFALGLLLAVFLYMRGRSRRPEFGAYKYNSTMFKAAGYEPERVPTFYEQYEDAKTFAMLPK